MLHCPCEPRPVTRFGVRAAHHRRSRPRLFNWITILLLTAWVALVMVIAWTTNPDAFKDTADVEIFLRRFL